MKINKKNPRKQLEKFSNIFLQLGLVLTLFVVFISIEHQSKQKEIADNPLKPDPVETYTLNETHPVIFVKEEVKPKVQPKPKTPIIQVIPIKNEETVTNSVIIKPTDEFVTPQITSKNIVEVDIVDDINSDDDPKLIVNVQEIPIYRGCENLSREESIKCLDSKLKKLVQHNFDADLASKLSLKSGIHRIFAKFVINEQGNVVNVQIKAPHLKLKQETNKVMSKIPKFTPGKQNGRTVKVKYTLPITFKVE